MKLKLFIFFFSLGWRWGLSQNHSGIDSLKLNLKTAITDSAKFTLHFKLYREYIEFNNDSALYHVEQQIAIADQNFMKLAHADALETKAYVLQKLGKNAESLQILNQALEIAMLQKNESRNWFPDSFGTVHEIQLRIIGYIQLDLGHVEGSINNTDNQVFHYKEALRQAKNVKNYELIGLASMNLGAVYLWEFNEVDSAFQMQQMALESFQKAGHKKWLNVVFGALGDIYVRKKENTLAVYYFHKAIHSALEVNNFENAFFSTLSLADHYIHEQNKDSSMYYAQKIGDMVRIQSAALPKNADEMYYVLLSKSYKLNNQVDSAYKYLNLLYILKDSSYQAQLKNLKDVQNLSFEEKIRTERLAKEKLTLQNRLRQYTLLGGFCVVLLVAFLLYRNNKQKQKSNIELAKTLSNLKSTQAQLIHSEKMASLGELTAGIAHEIQNPLNFVNNFSSINTELVEDLKQEIITGNSEEINLIINDIKENSEKINYHGQRASSIVQNMLEHSRTSSSKKELSNINQLCDEYLRLSYQGLRAKDKSFNSDYKTELTEDLPQILINKQEIARVLLNIINNAFQAVHEKSKKITDGTYNPLVTVKTEKENDTVKITISDNGLGIPDKIKDKIFQPFFTTKPTGQGTGLGLSLSYDIIKAHRGEITCISEMNNTQFIITLPIS